MASTEPALVTTSSGTAAWRYVGVDERGRELEIIAIQIDQADGEAGYLLVIHVMPSHLRK